MVAGYRTTGAHHMTAKERLQKLELLVLVLGAKDGWSIEDRDRLDRAFDTLNQISRPIRAGGG